MSGAASQTFSGGGTWTSPPGYAGPVLVTGFAADVGEYGINCSGLFTVSPNSAYPINAGGGLFNETSISASESCSSLTVTWWPNFAAYQLFVYTGTFTTPPGCKGPVLYYNHSYNSGNLFAGLALATPSGGVPSNIGIVQVANCADNTSYTVTVAAGTTIVVFFP